MANDDGNGDEEQVSTDVQVGGRDISMVTDGQEIESVLGWTVIYTIGPAFTVDRAWLEDRAEELGIPSGMLPSPVSPKRAHTRASTLLPEINTDMLSDNVTSLVPNGVELHTQRAKNDNNVFHLEITDRRGEEMTATEIGDLIYEDQGVYTRATTSDPEYIEWFQTISEEFNTLYEKHLRSNMGKDVRKMVRGFCKEHSTSVKMRDAGAVYFVPAQYQDQLNGLKTLIDDINTHWKNVGFDATIDTIEVIDSPAKREMVESKVRKALSETVEGLVEDALDSFDEEKAANEVVSGLGKELAQVENLAVEHNTLLNAEMSVKSALASWKDQVKSDEEQLIDELVASVDV